MIDKMFWQFAIKAVVEKQNSLQVDHKGRTPSSILHRVDLEDIPVKCFTLSFVQYTRYMHGYKVLEVQARQNENRGCVLEYNYDTRRSTPGASHLFGIQTQGE